MEGRRPALGCFADSHTTKVPNAFYYSRYWCPGALCVDGFVQDWAPPKQGPVLRQRATPALHQPAIRPDGPGA